MFYFEEINSKKILRSDLIIKTQAFFTTREFVLKSEESDLQSVVENNKTELCNFLNVERKNLIFPVQTHSANIAIVQDDIYDYSDIDALVLSDTKHAIFLNFADCTPIILYDEKQNIGAISHAGWRGTVQKIAPLTVLQMVEKFGTKPENIIALIGPAISPCCYEVGEDVFNKLKFTVSNFKNLYENFNGKIHVDLKAINRRQLEEIGVKKIDVCPYCTSCDNEYFFSYRKENGTTNRHSAVLKLADD